VDPLKRDNPGVRATNHEDRIQALERRIFIQPSVWALAILSTDQTISGAEFLEFDEFWTGDDAIFGTNTGAAGYTALTCAEFGVYHAQCVVEWEQTGADYFHSIQLQSSRVFGPEFSSFATSPASASNVRLNNDVGDLINLPLVDSAIGVHSPWDYLPTQPASWQIMANVTGATPADVTRATLMVVLLPSDEKEQDYVVF